MKKWLQALLLTIARRLTAKPDQVTPLREEVAALKRIIESRLQQPVEEVQRRYMALRSELIEAMQMAGAGPWQASPATIEATKALIQEADRKLGLRETQADGSIGAAGDINLLLANVQWKRDIQLSFLEFSRWGIQQIILICRLYYIKNPIFRRLTDVCADYIFSRGVEVACSDPKATEIWNDFVERNRSVFGQVALVETQKAKCYDGNIFWVYFPDRKDTGNVDCRRFDATEVQEILVNPDDRTEARFYRRMWVQQQLDDQYNTSTESMERWYPSLAYYVEKGPDAMPESIRGIKVEKEMPVYHRKCGFVAQWLFGLPTYYPMVDWCRESRILLEACASIKQSLMQIAMTITTKGGQQAIEGIKQQMQTTVGPNTNLWDQNPPAVPGATIVSGPGTELKAFDSSKGGGNPDDAVPYIRMCVMVAGVPETFVSILANSNLATATSLDRPTETKFLKDQEEWREDLTIHCKFVLSVSAGAPSGKLRESFTKAPVKIQILECRRHIGLHGEVVYEAFSKEPDKLEIRVNFPAIREGDQKARIDGLVAALTLGNKGGQIIGIDEKVGVRELYNACEIEGGDELAEEQYPEGEYERDRTKEILPAPIQKTELPPGGQPQIDPRTGEPTDPAPQEQPKVQEARVRGRWIPNGR